MLLFPEQGNRLQEAPLKDLTKSVRMAMQLRRLGAALVAVGLATIAAACSGPLVLERQVLGYDEVTKSLDEKLLLLNIARIAGGEPAHFTSTSSIAATFDWTATLGVGGQIEGSSGTDFLNLNLGGSASENPTFSIFPVSGQDFTKRVLTPFTDTVFEFLVFQDGHIGQIMRLMASGIEVQGDGGTFRRFIKNDPRRPQEYEEFRQIAARLQALNHNRQLFVRSLVFEDTLVSDLAAVPSGNDIINAFDQGLRWQKMPDDTYQLTGLVSGRVLVSNYDPTTLSDAKRFELNEQIERNPSGFVFLDIRPDGPGGDEPLRGAIKLRSIYLILAFLGSGIEAAPELPVALEPAAPRTASDAPGDPEPVATMKINVTSEAPPEDVPAVRYRDRYFSLNDTLWDRFSFTILTILFQTAVGDIENVGIPITIAK
jgi:hypothetical protein